MISVTVRAGTQEVEDRGNGEPLLWLPSAFGEAGWLPVHEQLASNWRVVVPQAPSLQPGGVLEDIDDIDDYMLHLMDVLAELEVGPAVVAGASFGGWMAAELATRYPDRVRALVLLAPLGLRVEGHPVPELFTLTVPELARLTVHDLDTLDVGALPTFDRDGDRIGTHLRMVEGMEAMARFGWSPYLHNPRLPDRLRRYRGPALLAWGEHDRLVPMAHRTAWEAVLDEASIRDVVLVEGVGHLSAIEAPDAVASQLHDWLTKEKVNDA